MPIVSKWHFVIIFLFCFVLDVHKSDIDAVKEEIADLNAKV